MRIKVLLWLALVMAATSYLTHSLWTSPELDPGIYSLEKNGFKFSIVLLEGGRHIQKLEMPDGTEYSSKGEWKIVELSKIGYLKATDIYIGALCSSGHESDDELPKKEEVSLPLYLNFAFQTEVMMCSEGRGLVRE